MFRLMCLLLMLGITVPSYGANVLYFKSERGDYIGGGQERIFTDADFRFGVSKNYDNGVSVWINNYATAPWGKWESWSLDTAAPNRALLQVGAYEGATRFPFQAYDKPGLSFTGSGRGCNRSYGRFDVLEVVYGTNGQVTSFAANFEQHCEWPTAPALFGQIRYNSDIPITRPLFARITVENPLNSGHCVEAADPTGASVRVNASASRDSNGGTDLSYFWQTTSGITSTDPQLALQVGLNETVDVRLTVTENSSGNSSTTSVPVCVSDTTAPTVAILSPAAGAILVGDGFSIDVKVTDSVDTNIAAYELDMGLAGQFTLDPATNEGTVRMVQAEAGSDPVPVTLTIVARDASGNVGFNRIVVYKAHDARFHAPNQ